MSIRRTAAVLSLAVALAAPGAARAAGRSAKEITADLTSVEGELRQLQHPDAVKYNPLYRAQMAREYGPPVERERTLLAELATATPKAAAAYHHLATMDDASLAFWGVGGAADRVDAAAADPATAADGKLAKLLVRWWEAHGNADGQNDVASDVEAMAAAAPTSNAVADAIHLMVTTNPATVAVGQRLTAVLTVKLAKTPIGKQYAAVPNKIDEPLAVDGMQLNGKPFHAKDWAGKVVLVDFWATWCPPCREEIPHVAKVYAQYHDQGLEIIGVSSDNDKRTMAAFLKEHAEMPWPELFGSTSGWHPLTKKFGINSIPTMYLLDRQGNLRSVEARSEMDTLIPVLLAEAYTPPALPPKPASGARPAAAGAANPATPTGGVPADAIHDAARRAARATMH